MRIHYFSEYKQKKDSLNDDCLRQTDVITLFFEKDNDWCTIHYLPCRQKTQRRPGRKFSRTQTTSALLPNIHSYISSGFPEPSQKTPWAAHSAAHWHLYVIGNGLGFQLRHIRKKFSSMLFNICHSNFLAPCPCDEPAPPPNYTIRQQVLFQKWFKSYKILQTPIQSF